MRPAHALTFVKSTAVIGTYAYHYLPTRQFYDTQTRRRRIG